MTQDKPHSGDTTTVERVAKALRFRRDEAKSPGYGYVCADAPPTDEELADAHAAIAVLATDNADEPSEIIRDLQEALRNCSRGQSYRGLKKRAADYLSAMQAARGQS